MESEGRKSRSREIASRFLSTSPSSTSIDHKQPRDIRKNNPSHEGNRFTSNRWPSSFSPRNNVDVDLDTLADHLGNERLNAPKNNDDDVDMDTLADHLGNERLNDYLERKNEWKSDVSSLIRRFENKESKENHRPTGGSMRYTTEKLRFGGKSPSSSSTSSSSNSGFVSGRLSVDEKALNRKSDTFLNNLDSECSDKNKSRSLSWRKSGIEVSSKYMNDVSSWSQRKMDEDPLSLDSAPLMKRFTIKNAIKRANSLTGYGAMSQWALSPGRTGSSPMSVDNKAQKTSFSRLKPPSPSKVKGVEKLLKNMGLDLFKSKKSTALESSPMIIAGNVDTVHQLRLLHNRLMQWRYANAKAYNTNEILSNQAEKNLVNGWNTLTSLRRSTIQKKLQLQKEKLEMKLESILNSQIESLEDWGEIERQHLSSISRTKECLHSAVCRVPLVDGAKMDPHLASLSLGHASDFTTFIESRLMTFYPSAEKTVSLLSQLAEVVAEERLVMDEILEYFQTMSTLDVREKSLQCCIMQYEQSSQPYRQEY